MCTLFFAISALLMMPKPPNFGGKTNSFLSPFLHWCPFNNSGISVAFFKEFEWHFQEILVDLRYQEWFS